MPDHQEQIDALRRALLRASAARWDAEAALIRARAAEARAREALRLAERPDAVSASIRDSGGRDA